MSVTDWDLNKSSKELSAQIVSTILFWILTLWAAINITTFVSQILEVVFKLYVRFSSILALIIFIVCISVVIKKFLSNINAAKKDLPVLLGLLFIFTAGAVISLSYHTTGRLFLDDFYLTANPVYYSQHTTANMGFEARTFYSGKKPVISTAFLTAGGYEYGLTILSYLFKIDYMTAYYRFGAIFNSLLLVLSTYLTLSYFTDNKYATLAGTFLVSCLLIIMSENSWAIGGLALVHSYEGKAILIIDGIPLLVGYSLEHFNKNTTATWLQLFILITAMTGMSTSSMMIIPIFSIIIFAACLITFKKPRFSLWSLIILSASYFGSFIYLVVFGIFVALTDKPSNALIFNASYPDSFGGYLNTFLTSSTWPATVSISIFSFIAAVLFTKNQKRTFIALWGLLAIVLALNPLSAQLLLLIFRGIYFRLFYILLTPIFAGIAISTLFSNVEEKFGIKWRNIFLGTYTFFTICLLFLIPSSIFMNSRYTYGNWAPSDDFPTARKIINNIPEGVTLAPYPLSGAIRMLSSNNPQMITRNDILSFYLGAQGRNYEANLRINVNNFLQGQGDSQSFDTLLKSYPEIRTIIFVKDSLTEIKSVTIMDYLQQKGFVKHLVIDKYVAFWK